jgi:hypothetical protein
MTPKVLTLSTATLNLCQSESYVTTDGQSASLSWCQALIGGPSPDFYYCHTVSGLLMWGAFLTRGRVCRLQFLLGFASAVILEYKSRGTHGHILLSLIRDSPNLEGQDPVFISPKNRMARLYPQALGSIFFASYGSQGYGGGIRIGLNTGDRAVKVKVKVKFKDMYFTTRGLLPISISWRQAP